MSHIPLIIFFIVIIGCLAAMTWIGYRGYEKIMDILRSFGYENVEEVIDSQDDLTPDDSIPNEIPESMPTDVVQEDSQNPGENSQREGDDTPDQDTAAMAYELLESEGCMPRYEDDSGIICKFQGETFILIPNMKFIRIFDPNWATTKITDDDFNVVVDAINRTNHNFGPVILMSPPHPETGQIAISSRCDIYFSESIPNLKTYFFTMLGSFFETQKKMRLVFEDLKSNPDQCMIYENPIGFDTASLSNLDSPRAN